MNSKFDDIVPAGESGCAVDQTFLCGGCANLDEFSGLVPTGDAVEGVICGVIGCSNVDDVVSVNLSTINGKKAITMYHGTTLASAKEILSGGLKEFSCLTTNLDIAEYYAECACDETCLSYDNKAIVAVVVSNEDLTVDYCAYEEPLALYRNNYTTSDSEWFEMCESGEIPFPKNKTDVEPALLATECARIKSAVAVEYIELFSK